MKKKNNKSNNFILIIAILIIFCILLILMKNATKTKEPSSLAQNGTQNILSEENEIKNDDIDEEETLKKNKRKGKHF